MRKYLFPLFAIILFIGTSCQTGTNPENEEEALLDVLRQEAEAMLAGDMEAVFALHTQDVQETRLELGVFGYNTYEGWPATISGNGMMMGVSRKDMIIYR